MATAREKYLAKCADDKHRRRYRAEGIARQEHKVIKAAKALVEANNKGLDDERDEAVAEVIRTTRALLAAEEE